MVLQQISCDFELGARSFRLPQPTQHIAKVAVVRIVSRVELYRRTIGPRGLVILPEIKACSSKIRIRPVVRINLYSPPMHQCCLAISAEQAVNPAKIVASEVIVRLKSDYSAKLLRGVAIASKRVVARAQRVVVFPVPRTQFDCSFQITDRRLHVTLPQRTPAQPLLGFIACRR